MPIERVSDLSGAILMLDHITCMQDDLHLLYPETIVGPTRILRIVDTFQMPMKDDLKTPVYIDL